MKKLIRRLQKLWNSAMKYIPTQGAGGSPKFANHINTFRIVEYYARCVNVFIGKSKNKLKYRLKTMYYPLYNNYKNNI